ncbi:DUF6777 domain-containing protein [Pseudonocardia asaccharolytica]|uniref:DUF6777 domain-containing protein n=1 Tax=Pseudonocardia asaccharolytica DSM 44247 = NBRC 16224 TaxID=1123024 RepID=A0A511D260_9PSEU|nr:DUF6777 domain-containing protein [Pseudonocardia asaccharolytica]GEL18870.1 hypothetical protein PA7_27070 [Pseudonocardia asaccharolytica DSM 44247 = NBRC 16224]
MADSGRPPRPVTSHRFPVRSQITLIVAAVALGLAGGAFWAGLSPSATTVEVRLEATSSPGPSPFTSAAGKDRAGVAPTAGVAGELPADTAGLFGAPGAGGCDAQRLASDLQADQGRASAWAGALGVGPGDIAKVTARLAPVVLRADAGVVEHGFAGGAATAYPAVLQAGTVVLVDERGEPKVKCVSGNPLTAAQSFGQANYVGTPWPYFQPSLIAYVRPATDKIKTP